MNNHLAAEAKPGNETRASRTKPVLTPSVRPPQTTLFPFVIGAPASAPSPEDEGKGVKDLPPPVAL